MTKKIKHQCTCENCGNESEMEITCSMVEYEEAVEAKEDKGEIGEIKVKGSGTCVNCGNEADMWIDI